MKNLNLTQLIITLTQLIKNSDLPPYVHNSNAGV